MSARNYDEAISPDEDVADVETEFDTDDDDELADVYEQGFEAGQRNVREGGETDNPYALANLTAHERWRDGYDDGNHLYD
jgi:hypothetical protein